MRRYLLLVFVHLSLIGFGQEAKPVITLRCGSNIPQNKPPLCIVDGVLMDFAKGDKIDPNDIIHIEILKSSNEITAIYGSAGLNGVILITTKNKPMQMTLVDDTEGKAIPAATARFVNGKDSFYLVSDSNGVIRSNRIKGNIDYHVTLSSVGYAEKEFSWVTFADDNAFYWTMSREAVTLSPVIVTGYPAIICKRIVQYITHHWPRSEESLSIKSVDRLDEGSLRTYPNPVARGSRFIIEVNQPIAEPVSVRVLTLDGRPVLTNTSNLIKGLNRLSVNTSGGWSAGMYFIQVLNKEGTARSQQRILIN